MATAPATAARRWLRAGNVILQVFSICFFLFHAPFILYGPMENHDEIYRGIRMTLPSVATRRRSRRAVALCLRAYILLLYGVA
jgi:hypothetical protein